MGEALVIRPATAADFATVGRITADVYVGEGYVPSSLTERLLDVASRAAATTILVAVDHAGAGVVGAVSLVRPGSTFAQIAREGEAEVRMLAVSPEARGGGFGQALMVACVGLARDWQARTLVLSTQQTMKAAQRLYERLGMTRTESRDWVSKYGDTRMVYELPLV